MDAGLDLFIAAINAIDEIQACADEPKNGWERVEVLVDGEWRDTRASEDADASRAESVRLVAWSPAGVRYTSAGLQTIEEIDAVKRAEISPDLSPIESAGRRIGYALATYRSAHGGVDDDAIAAVVQRPRDARAILDRVWPDLMEAGWGPFLDSIDFRVFGDGPDAEASSAVSIGIARGDRHSDVDDEV